MLCEHYEALRNITEALCTIMGRYGTSQSIAGCYGTLREHYVALTERYETVMENIDFAHHTSTKILHLKRHTIWQ